MRKTIHNLSLYDFLIVPLQFYSIVGVKLFQWTDDDVMTRREKIMLSISLINMVLNFTAKTSYFLFDEFDSAVHMTQWFLYLIFACNSYCKMFSVLLGRKKLHRAINELERLFPKSTQERRDFHLMDGYGDLMRHLKIMITNHWSIALMFMIFPVVQSTIAYWSSSAEEDRKFVGYTPYIMTYPFEASRGFGYAYAYITQFMGGFTVSCYFVGSDMLLMCTIYMVFMQYEYLNRRVKTFKAKAFDNDMNELKKLLDIHCVINELAESINSVFSFSILLNYMISIVVIVLIGIQITNGSEMLDFVKFFGFFTSAACQVYYVCMFGTKLLEHSSEVSESFFGQEWFMADVRYQRMIVLAIARSQKSSHLTAYKFFMISMESFANLMTTSYQFFTLLKTRMEEGK